MTSYQPVTLGSTILVVDDMPANLRLLKMILSEQGYTVRTASNGTLALKAIQIDRPDLILLDIMLPDMSGYDICEKIKEDEKAREIPVIFISSLQEAFDKVRAFFVGGVDYIGKPFQTEEVLARVETHLTLRNLKKHQEQQNELIQKELIERRQAEETLQLRNRELAMLNRIGKMFGSSLELDNVLETVLAEVQRLLDAFSTSFWLLDPKTGDLVCMHAKGSGSKKFITWRVSKGQGMMNWAIKHNESVLVADTQNDERHLKEIDVKTGVSIKSTLCIPLRAKGKVIGVLNLIDQREGFFSKNDERMLEPIAAEAAIAIENARLYTTAQQEISGRKKFADSLKRSEKRYRSLFENATVGIFQATFKGKFMTVNSTLARLLGYPSASTLGKTIQNIPEELFVEPQQWQEIIDLARTSREPVMVETRCRTKDGKEIIVSLNIWAVRDKQDRVRYAQGFMEDITEQKQMAEALEKSLAQIEQIKKEWESTADSLGSLICLLDSQKRIIRANRTIEDWNLGRVVDVRDKNIHALFHPNCSDPTCYLETFLTQQWEQVAQGEPIRCEAEDTILHRYVSIQIRPILSQTHETLKESNSFAVCSIIDITTRKQTEKTLLNQTILLRGVTEAMRRLLVSTEFESSIKATLEMLGFVMEIERISIFETHSHPKTNEPLMSQRFTWTQNQSGIEKKERELQNIPYNPGFTRWYDMLKANKIVSGLVREFPESEREILQPQKVRSILVAPITVQQRFWGFIRFDDCRTERGWSQEEKFALSAMAGGIGGAIARQQT